MGQTICTIQSLRENIKKELHGSYPEREIHSMIEILFTHRLGWQKHEAGLRRHEELAGEDSQWIRSAVDKIRDHYPLQYITGTKEFAGIPLKIRPGVLIPRPETEELVDWICTENRLEKPEILDIGTGCGCIALALKKLIPGSEVTGTDISAEALALGKENSDDLGLPVRFILHDIMEAETQPRELDIIVSNPPYIPESEKSGMDRNVTLYEPHSALFVPDHDPLIFYRRIMEFSKTHLNKGGTLYFEIHERLADRAQALSEQHGFAGITLRTDMHGRDRMLKGIKP